MVSGELLPTKGKCGRDERDCAGDDLPRPGRKTSAAADGAGENVDAAIAPRTVGRSNGNRACGSALRTTGSNANASASLSGPRSTGVVTAPAKRGLRPEAT